MIGRMKKIWRTWVDQSLSCVWTFWDARPPSYGFWKLTTFPMLEVDDYEIGGEHKSELIARRLMLINEARQLQGPMTISGLYFAPSDVPWSLVTVRLLIFSYITCNCLIPWLSLPRELANKNLPALNDILSKSDRRLASQTKKSLSCVSVIKS